MPYYTDEPCDDLDVEWPSDDWKPVYWVGMKSHNTLGDKIADWIEKFMSPPRKIGDAPFKVLPWQRWFLRHAFELDENKLFRWREVFLQIPRKNGKSFLISGINLYFLAHSKPGEQYLLAANSRPQAGIMYDECRRNVDASPALRLVLHANANRITNKFTGSFLERVTGDGDGSQGMAPYIASGDELHTWTSKTGASTRGQQLKQSLTTGSTDRAESIFLGITTAGERLSGVAYESYEQVKGLALGAIPVETVTGFVWEAEDEDDISDPEVWKKANPNLQAGVMPMAEFEKAYRKALSISTAGFERYNLNKWLRGGDRELFISTFHWNEIQDRTLGLIPKGSDICLGFDGSLTDDSTGIVGINPHTGHIELLYGWEKPPGFTEWWCDPEEVDAAMEKIFKEYNVVKLYADPSRHNIIVDKWRKTWGASIVRDIPPTDRRMPELSQNFKEAVYKKDLKHAGENRFTQHFKNAIETIKGTPNKESKNSARKIDFVACSVLAHGAMVEHLDRSKNKNRHGVRIF